MKRTMKRLALACAVVLALAGVSAAQSEAPTPAQQKELDAARADLDRAAKHFAELSGKYHAPGMAPMVMTYEKQTMRKPVLGVLLAPDPQAGVRHRRPPAPHTARRDPRPRSRDARAALPRTHGLRRQGRRCGW